MPTTPPIHTQSDFEKLLTECKRAIEKMTWKPTPHAAHPTITESYDGVYDDGSPDELARRPVGPDVKLWRATICAWREGPHFGVDGGISDINHGLMIKLPRELTLFAMEKAKHYIATKWVSNSRPVPDPGDDCEFGTHVSDAENYRKKG